MMPLTVQRVSPYGPCCPGSGSVVQVPTKPTIFKECGNRKTKLGNFFIM